MNQAIFVIMVGTECCTEEFNALSLFAVFKEFYLERFPQLIIKGGGNRYCVQGIMEFNPVLQNTR